MHSWAWKHGKNRHSVKRAQREFSGGTLFFHAWRYAPGVEPSFRFSGHQTFPLRIAWIPKALVEIVMGNDPLTNIDEGITRLGLGKNMVEALRCWIEAFQIADRIDERWSLTPIGSLIFHPEKAQKGVSSGDTAPSQPVRCYAMAPGGFFETWSNG